MNTRHANTRAQQRGIPPMIDWLLDLYGHEEYDHRGAIVLYFSKKSRQKMEREIGKRPLARLSEWLDAYKVLSTDGLTVTLGHRTKRVLRS